MFSSMEEKGRSRLVPWLGTMAVSMTISEGMWTKNLI